MLTSSPQLGPSPLWPIRRRAGPRTVKNGWLRGGNSGAYRSMVHAMTAGPSALRVFHASLSASYDPPSQGALNVIDYREDCSRQGAGTSSGNVQATLLLEQGARRYITVASTLCTAAVWVSGNGFNSLRATDFVQVDGPVCSPDASCPDFAASAAPLRFGFTRQVALLAGQPAGTVVHGVDNWKLTVWRR